MSMRTRTGRGRPREAAGGHIGALQIAQLNVALFRIVRILRLVRYLRNLRKLCTTLLHTLPALVNVGAVLMLLLYMFAVFGTAVFGKVRAQKGT